MCTDATYFIRIAMQKVIFDLYETSQAFFIFQENARNTYGVSETFLGKKSLRTRMG